MKIFTCKSTHGYQLPVDLGMFGPHLRQVDVPVSSVRHGWGANYVVRNADAAPLTAITPTDVVQQAPVPLSRLRARSLT